LKEIIFPSRRRKNCWKQGVLGTTYDAYFPSNASIYFVTKAETITN